jgi:flavin reductase (DIM6/NTAB) family NADH-FMN oxidoreductase RutF
VRIDPATLSPDAAYGWLAATIVPRPIAWVSTLNLDESTNLAPFSFFTGAGADPPMCIISVSRHGTGVKKDTWRNIERSGEYVIHVVPERLADEMNQTAKVFPYGVDEMVAVGLTKTPSERVAPPRIAEAPVAMECRLHQIVEVGRADNSSAIIIGEILLWHVSEDVLVDGRIDMGKLDAVGRMGGPHYTRTRDRFSLQRPK